MRLSAIIELVIQFVQKGRRWVLPSSQSYVTIVRSFSLRACLTEGEVSSGMKSTCRRLFFTQWSLATPVFLRADQMGDLWRHLHGPLTAISLYPLFEVLVSSLRTKISGCSNDKACKRILNHFQSLAEVEKRSQVMLPNWRIMTDLEMV